MAQLRALDDLDRREEEDMQFLCVNARERGRIFARKYRGLANTWMWQGVRLDWE